MTKEQIDNLILEGLPQNSVKTELVETHISWILISGEFVYKIKKPIHYLFLDFSTLENRKHYCEREIKLNKRLTSNLYIDVVAVKELSGKVWIEGTEGEMIEYAVRMRKMDGEKQMIFSYKTTG